MTRKMDGRRPSCPRRSDNDAGDGHGDDHSQAHCYLRHYEPRYHRTVRLISSGGIGQRRQNSTFGGALLRGRRVRGVKRSVSDGRCVQETARVPEERVTEEARALSRWYHLIRLGEGQRQWHHRGIGQEFVAYRNWKTGHLNAVRHVPGPAHFPPRSFPHVAMLLEWIRNHQIHEVVWCCDWIKAWKLTWNVPNLEPPDPGGRLVLRLHQSLQINLKCSRFGTTRSSGVATGSKPEN